jgi:hypothetical protein
MGFPISLGQTAQALPFMLIASSDHISGATGKSPAVLLSKNGSAFASPSGTVSEIANGWYIVSGNATDAGTLGPLLLHATAAGCDPTDDTFPVVAYNPLDAVKLGLTGFPSATAVATAVWTDLVAGTDFQVTGSIGKLLVGGGASGGGATSSVVMDSAAVGTPYLGVSEFLKRADVRAVADLVTDSGTRLGSSTNITTMASALASDPNLAAALADASGELESVCAIGKRYTAADLAVIATSATVSAARMFRILFRLTMCLLYERRLDKGEPPKVFAQVELDLKALREGEAIFSTVQAEAAGLPTDYIETVADVDRRNLSPTIAQRFFGVRGDRLR